jgi:hypothetical protein
MNRLAIALAFLLPACAVPADDEGGFSRGEAPSAEDAPEVAGEELDLEDPTDDPADDTVDGLGDDVDPGLDWEPLPVDAPTGAVWVGNFTCGMLRASSDFWMEKTPTGWRQTGRILGHPAMELISDEDSRPRGQIGEICFDRNNPDPSVEWVEDGSFHFFNGHWDHDLRPLPEEGRWLGQVSPMFNPSDACRAELESLGLTIPVTLTMTRLGIWY